MDTGVVVDHFSLHKRRIPMQKIIDQFNYYKYRMMWGFITGNFEHYMQPLGMIKNYYGQDFAFEYAFLLHYQSWLIFPAFFGIFFFAFQVFLMIQHPHEKIELRISQSLDNTGTPFYGLFVAFWGLIMITRWEAT